MLTEKGKEIVKSWITSSDSRQAANKLIDYYLRKMIGLSSSDLADTATFANRLYGIEDMLNDNDFDGAAALAKEIAQEMMSDEGMDMFGESKKNDKNKINEDLDLKGRTSDFKKQWKGELNAPSKFPINMNVKKILQQFVDFLPQDMDAEIKKEVESHYPGEVVGFWHVIRQYQEKFVDKKYPDRWYNYESNPRSASRSFNLDRALYWDNKDYFIQLLKQKYGEEEYNRLTTMPQQHGTQEGPITRIRNREKLDKIDNMEIALNNESVNNKLNMNKKVKIVRLDENQLAGIVKKTVEKLMEQKSAQDIRLLESRLIEKLTLTEQKEKPKEVKKTDTKK